MPASTTNLPTGAARDCAAEVGVLRTLHDHQRPRDPEVSQARALRPNQLQVCALQRLASFSRLDDDRHINTCQGVVTGLRKREGNRETVCVCGVVAGNSPKREWTATRRPTTHHPWTTDVVVPILPCACARHKPRPNCAVSHSTSTTTTSKLSPWRFASLGLSQLAARAQEQEPRVRNRTSDWAGRTRRLRNLRAYIHTL